MSIRPASLRPAAQSHLAWLVDVRRRLHRVPEVGLQNPITQAIVVEQLRGLGIEPHLGTATTSVSAVIEGRKAGGDPARTIVLRGDMDGLPLTEHTGLPFASEHEGRMHACGHDTHVTMLLGAARMLADRRDEFSGRVLLMFQPGEEGYHGARVMIEEGLLDGLDPARDAAFALHITTRDATDTLNVKGGPLMAAADRLLLTVKGRGGHASAPFLALDPITIAAELVIALNLMITRTVDAFDPAVLTVARITAGTTNNIIPPSAELEGTMRTVSEATRAAVQDRIRRVAAGVAAAHGAEVDVLIDPGYPVTINDPAFVDGFVALAREVAGPDAVKLMDAPIMGAEDFSYVLQRLPGAMAYLGARPADVDVATAPMNHSDFVVFDESAMALGVATYTAVALRHLGAM